MAKQIKSEEIIEKDALAQHIKETQTLIALYEKWDEEIKKVATNSKELVKNLDTTKVKDIERLASEQRKVNKATDDSNKLAKEKARLDERLKGLRTEEAKQNEIIKAQISERRRQLKAEAKDVAGITGEYTRQSRRLNDLRKRYKDLAAAGRENGKVARGLRGEITKLDVNLKGIDKSVGQSQRNVGNYSSALDGLNGKFRGAIRLASQFGLALGGVQIIKSSLKVITDFDQAVTDLAAISGKTADELKPLNDQAKELGATTQFTASEITGLQIELAKLGFTTQEITDSTGGIANFAAATGVEIPRAAALAGSALRAFGLETSEIDRVVSTLGVATTKTALDFSKLEAGLSTVAPVAASFGFSIEDTTALLGQLSNAGFDASSAATATRNILLNLADSNGALAQALGRPVTNAQELSEGLIELKASGIDLAGALELTDKRSVAAFNTFIENADTLPELTKSITDVNGELTDMAEKRLDSVQGQLQSLNSKWEGFILGTSESAGAVNFLKNAIGFLANNLSTIVRVIGTALLAFVSYKASVIGANIVTTAYQVVTKGAAIAQALFTGNLKRATAGMRLFNTAVKANPLGLLASALTTAILLLWDFTDANNDAAKSEKKKNDEIERGNQLRKERIEGQKTIDQQFKMRTTLSQAELKILKQQIESEIQLSEAAGLKIKTSKEEIATIQERKKALEELLKFTNSELLALENRTDISGQQIELTEEEIKRRDELRKKNAELSYEYSKISKIEQKLRDEGIKLTDNEVANLELREEQLREVNKLIKEETGYINPKREFTNAIKKQTKAYEDLVDARRKLFELQIEATGDEESILILDSDKELNEIEEFKREYIRKKKEIYGADAELNERELEAFKELQQEKEEELKRSLAEMQREKRLDRIDVDKELAELDLQILENQMNRELELVTGKDQEAVDKRNAIRFKYMNDRANLLNEIAYMEIQALEEEIQMWEESGEPIAKAKIEALQKQIELKKQETQAKGQAIAQEKEEVDQVNELTQSYANYTQVFDEFASMRIKKLDEEIAKIDELIEASKKRESELSELRAKEGADVAESLAFEQQKQAEALARKEELERKKRRTELATAVINLVSSKIEQGSTNPTGEAFAEIASIQGFIQSLPQFWEGTDTTVGDAVGMKYSDGRDGVLARVDKSEMILNKDKVDRLRGMGITRTDDIVNMAKMWKSSNAIQSHNDFGVVVNSKPHFDSKGIESKLSRLESENSEIKGYLKSINEKPVQVFDVKKMGDYVDLISKKVEGNKTTRTYKRYR